jgi:hypothetical protein
MMGRLDGDFIWRWVRAGEKGGERRAGREERNGKKQPGSHIRWHAVSLDEGQIHIQIQKPSQRRKQLRQQGESVDSHPLEFVSLRPPEAILLLGVRLVPGSAHCRTPG